MVKSINVDLYVCVWTAGTFCYRLYSLAEGSDFDMFSFARLLCIEDFAVLLCKLGAFQSF